LSAGKLKEGLDVEVRPKLSVSPSQQSAVPLMHFTLSSKIPHKC
jgi:hypothetical protein